MFKEIRDLPAAVADAQADIRRASTAVVEAGEATQSTMVGLYAVACVALLLATVALVVVARRAA